MVFLICGETVPKALAAPAKLQRGLRRRACADIFSSAHKQQPGPLGEKLCVTSFARRSVMSWVQLAVSTLYGGGEMIFN